MVTILKYVLFGFLLYILIIPLIEELTTILVQGLEVVKGLFILKIAELQVRTNALTKEEKSSSKSTAIGFVLPEEDDYEEEDEDDDYP